MAAAPAARRRCLAAGPLDSRASERPSPSPRTIAPGYRCSEPAGFGLMITAEMNDAFGRPLRNLRLSVTDRCNLRCSYCMPEADYVWLPKEDILDFEEIERLVDIFSDLGVDKIRLTGGEPLLRRNLPDLVSRLARRPTIRDLAMTTNGVLLAAHA